LRHCVNRFYRLEIYSFMVGFFDPACELLPHGRRNYSGVLLPLYLLSDLPRPSPLFKLIVQYSIYRQCMAVRGRWGGFELCCRPYSAGVLHSVSDQIQSLQICFTTPNKMSSKDDIKGLVSLKVHSSMVSSLSLTQPENISIFHSNEWKV
jgi:hypothetical protein